MAFYRQLGLIQIVDSPPRYARFECPAGDATFSLHRVDDGSGAHQVVVYFEIDDVDAKVAELRAAGLEIESDPRDEPWLWREARLRDPAGNQICLYYAGDNRRFPPWRIPASTR